VTFGFVPELRVSVASVFLILIEALKIIVNAGISNINRKAFYFDDLRGVSCEFYFFGNVKGGVNSLFAGNMFFFLLKIRTTISSAANHNGATSAVESLLGSISINNIAITDNGI
jgi:hypothetical protein